MPKHCTLLYLPSSCDVQHGAKSHRKTTWNQFHPNFDLPPTARLSLYSYGVWISSQMWERPPLGQIYMNHSQLPRKFHYTSLKTLREVCMNSVLQSKVVTRNYSRYFRKRRSVNLHCTNEKSHILKIRAYSTLRCL